MIDISVSCQEVQVDLLSNKIKTNLKNVTNLNHWLSLNEHLFQGADTLFKVLHGHLDDHKSDKLESLQKQVHLTSAPGGDCLGQLRNVLVQLVPTNAQGLCLGLGRGGQVLVFRSLI